MQEQIELIALIQSKKHKELNDWIDVAVVETVQMNKRIHDLFKEYKFVLHYLFSVSNNL